MSFSPISEFCNGMVSLPGGGEGGGVVSGATSRTESAYDQTKKLPCSKLQTQTLHR
jgi:hypothetical protein